MANRIYVRNLSEQMNSSELEEMFSSVGDVESAVVELKTIHGVHHRVGYVQMATEQQVLDCILRYNGFKKDGVALVVSEDKPHVPDPNYTYKKPVSNYKPKRKS